ncbi:hypothetical protein EB118_03975 [bacterium]|nr:hypothetical protein [bacterium]
MEGGKRSAWMKHVKATMKAHRGLPLSAVLKMAKKTYKKHTGGTYMEKMGPMGGARHRGGQLYGFTGGPYTGSELSDGAGRFKYLPDASYQNPGSELLHGGADVHPLAPVAKGGQPAQVPFTPGTETEGGRRRRRTTRRRKTHRRY